MTCVNENSAYLSCLIKVIILMFINYTTNMFN